MKQAALGGLTDFKQRAAAKLLREEEDGRATSEAGSPRAGATSSPLSKGSIVGSTVGAADAGSLGPQDSPFRTRLAADSGAGEQETEEELTHGRLACWPIHLPDRIVEKVSGGGCI